MSSGAFDYYQELEALRLEIAHLVPEPYGRVQLGTCQHYASSCVRRGTAGHPRHGKKHASLLPCHFQFTSRSNTTRISRGNLTMHALYCDARGFLAPCRSKAVVKPIKTLASPIFKIIKATLTQQTPSREHKNRTALPRLVLSLNSSADRQ